LTPAISPALTAVMMDQQIITAVGVTALSLPQNE